MWFIRENSIKMDDLGVPPFLETPTWLQIFLDPGIPPQSTVQPEASAVMLPEVQLTFAGGELCRERVQLSHTGKAPSCLYKLGYGAIINGLISG